MAEGEKSKEKRPKRVAFDETAVDNEGSTKRRKLNVSPAEAQAAALAEEEDQRGLAPDEGDPDLDEHYDDDDDDDIQRDGDDKPEDRITHVEGEEEEDIVESLGKEDVPLEPFNLKKEQEEGYFDKDGSYVQHKDKEAEQGDAWLLDTEVVSEEVAKRHKDMWESQDEGVKDNPEELQLAIVELLQPNETVVRALRRFKGNNANKNKNKQGKQAVASEEDGKDMEKFARLTECADKLLGLGHYNIYEETPASLRSKMGQGPVSGSAPTNNGASSSNGVSVSAPVGIKWEYKWGMESTDVYGPFSSTDMRAWSEQGHFKDQNVVVRHANSTLPFAPIERVQFRGP